MKRTVLYQTEPVVYGVPVDQAEENDNGYMEQAQASFVTLAAAQSVELSYPVAEEMDVIFGDNDFCAAIEILAQELEDDDYQPYNESDPVEVTASAVALTVASAADVYPLDSVQWLSDKEFAKAEYDAGEFEAETEAELQFGKYPDYSCDSEEAEEYKDDDSFVRNVRLLRGVSCVAQPFAATHLSATLPVTASAETHFSSHAVTEDSYIYKGESNRFDTKCDCSINYQTATCNSMSLSSVSLLSAEQARRKHQHRQDAIVRWKSKRALRVSSTRPQFSRSRADSHAGQSKTGVRSRSNSHTSLCSSLGKGVKALRLSCSNMNDTNSSNHDNHSNSRYSVVSSSHFYNHQRNYNNISMNHEQYCQDGSSLPEQIGVYTHSINTKSTLVVAENTPDSHAFPLAATNTTVRQLQWPWTNLNSPASAVVATTSTFSSLCSSDPSSNVHCTLNVSTNSSHSGNGQTDSHPRSRSSSHEKDDSYITNDFQPSPLNLQSTSPTISNEQDSSYAYPQINKTLLPEYSTQFATSSEPIVAQPVLFLDSSHKCVNANNTPMAFMASYEHDNSYHDKNIKSVTLTEVKDKSNSSYSFSSVTNTIGSTLVKSEHIVKNVSARKQASAKRLRENGRFKKTHIKWVSVTDLFLGA